MHVTALGAFIMKGAGGVGGGWGGSEQWFPSMVWRSGPNDTSETLKGSIINFRFESFFFLFLLFDSSRGRHGSH